MNFPHSYRAFNSIILVFSIITAGMPHDWYIEITRRNSLLITVGVKGLHSCCWIRKYIQCFRKLCLHVKCHNCQTPSFPMDITSELKFTCKKFVSACQSAIPMFNPVILSSYVPLMHSPPCQLWVDLQWHWQKQNADPLLPLHLVDKNGSSSTHSISMPSLVFSFSKIIPRQACQSKGIIGVCYLKK